MDINCDLGEGEPLARTRALLRQVTSANIACGGHAGTDQSMRRCLQLCRELGVRAGAHPGYADRENFGRVERVLSVGDFTTLIAQQLGALSRIAKAEGVKLSHIKLHGALYHAVEKSPALTRAYVGFLREYAPRLVVVALAGGALVQAARAAGLKAWGEVFAERGYTPEGRLIARTEVGALIEDLAAIRTRLVHWQQYGTFPNTAALDAQTICIHSDSPGAVSIAKLLARVFRARRSQGSEVRLAER